MASPTCKEETTEADDDELEGKAYDRLIEGLYADPPNGDAQDEHE